MNYDDIDASIKILTRISLRTKAAAQQALLNACKWKGSDGRIKDTTFSKQIKFHLCTALRVNGVCAGLVVVLLLRRH